MRNSIVVVDDRKQDREKLIAALASRGLGDRVVPYGRIKDAKKAIAASGEFPVAIVSDLRTGEGNDLENGKEFLQSEFRRAVKRTGGGIWTILVSQDLYKLREKTEDSPEIHRSLHKRAGWAKECADLVAPLYRESLPEDSDLGPLVPFTTRDKGVVQNVVLAKDRIFLYSSCDSDLSHVVADCPLLEVPEELQRQSPVRPIAMYRGNFVVLNGSNTLQVAQLLRRWRAVTSECKIPCQRKELTGDGTVPGPTFAALHNVVGDLRRIDHLERLSRYLFARAEFVPEVKKDDIQVGCPPELSSTPVCDGFYTRLHFFPDADDLKHWEKWQLWRAQWAAAAQATVKP